MPTESHVAAKSRARNPTSLARLRKVCLAYPEAVEVEQFGEPWFKAGKKSFCVYGEREVRVGGGYRYLKRMPNGSAIAFIGSYLDVKPVSRLVYTFQAEGQPGAPVTTTVELAEMAGTTTVTLTNEFPSTDLGEAAVKYGATGGARAALVQLAHFVEGA